MEDSPSKPSVAELAGRFKGHILPMPNSHEELPFRRRPPCSLKLRNQTDDNEESDKCTVFPAPSKIKMKNSAMIEKLQANLALSPTALLPSPKSPEVKLQPAPPSPTTPRSPMSPLTPLSPNQQLSSEEEEPAGFDCPAEGALLPSINKTRARLSFKRRPPTRQHRRSAGEEAGAFGGGLSQSELCSPQENGDRDRDSDDPEEEEEEAGERQLDTLEAGQCQDVNCNKTDAEATKDKGDLRQEAEEAESFKEEKLKPSGHGEQEEREEGRGEHENDRM